VMVNQDGTPYVGDPVSPPHALGRLHSNQGRPAPPLYDSRAEAADYATGWYEHSARPAPDTLHPRWRWIRLQRMWRQIGAVTRRAALVARPCPPRRAVPAGTGHLRRRES
jgi:hypothetical protein